MNLKELAEKILKLPPEHQLATTKALIPSDDPYWDEITEITIVNNCAHDPTGQSNHGPKYEAHLKH